MGNRLELHSLLKTLNPNVYFQPPANVDMIYPAIVYSRRKISNVFADNSVYQQTTSYMITVIDRDPDGSLAFKISELPTAQFDRGYTKDNLNHDVFTLSY